MKRQLLAACLLAVVVALAPAAAPALAQSGTMWRADYHNTPDWRGAPVVTEYIGFLSVNWGYGSPSPFVPADNFTARFTTDAFFYAGNYNFTIVADDEFSLIVDGIPYLNSFDQGLSGKQVRLTRPMQQGMHRVEVLYREWSQTAYLYVNWAYGGSTPPPAPPQGPQYPPLPRNAASVITKYGDFTPCLKQGIHQANCFVSDGAWDSPNLGSIQMEPQINAWLNCEPADQDQTFYVGPTEPAKAYRCSKTLGGWYPR